MTDKWTPGPWRWEGAALLAPTMQGHYFDDAVMRCVGSMTPEPADAALIAAAPELVEALRGLIVGGEGAIRVHRATYHPSAELPQLETAITQARALLDRIVKEANGG